MPFIEKVGLPTCGLESAEGMEGGVGWGGGKARPAALVRESLKDFKDDSKQSALWGDHGSGCSVGVWKA